MFHTKSAFMLAAGLCVSALPGVSLAAPIVAGFDQFTMQRTDDLSTDLVDIGFDVNFFGQEYSQLFVNNNGNVTFDRRLGQYTPFGLEDTDRIIIAPFFADVDTRNTNRSLPVTYGTGTYDGQTAFGVNWIEVDYYYSPATVEHSQPNSFQLLLVDRENGDFDIVFNYDVINWEAGLASGSNNGGKGGSSAVVGYSNGLDSYYEFDGSLVNGAFLYNGANSLTGKSFTMQVRNGAISDPIPSVPEPETWAMLLAGLGVMGAFAKRRRKA